MLGSKFITVCMTGDKDEILVPSKDAHELAFTMESKGEGEAKYIPGLFYSRTTAKLPLCALLQVRSCGALPQEIPAVPSTVFPPRPGQQRPRAERPQLCSYRVHRDQEGCDQ